MAVYKNKDGRTYYFKGKIRLSNGEIKYYKRTRIKYAKKKEAEEAERLYRESIIASNSRKKLNDVYTIYHSRWEAQGISESSLLTDEQYYNNHIRDYLGNMYVDEISPNTVEQWQQYMIHKKKHNGTQYAERTINKAKEALSKYLTYAVRLEFITSNPCQYVKNYHDPKNIGTHENNNFWELSEYKRFISVVDEPLWNDVFTLLFETGVRKGEMFALTWNDIDFVQGSIHIRHSLTNKTSDSSTYRIKEPKNRRSNRTIEISNSLLNRLKKRLESAKKIDGFTSDYFVFGDLRPLSRTTLSRKLDTYCNIAKVKRITVHGFRHSCATFLISNKIDDTLIAYRMGHTVEELRRTYAHVYSSMRDDLHATLNSIFG